MHDRRTTGHQLADLNTGNRSSNRTERSAGYRPRLGVPSFELARGTTEPQQDALLALLLGFLSDRRDRKKGIETGHRGDSRSHGSLEKQPPMGAVLRTAAVDWIAMRLLGILGQNLAHTKTATSD
jgi:hypothetical protein